MEIEWVLGSISREKIRYLCRCNTIASNQKNHNTMTTRLLRGALLGLLLALSTASFAQIKLSWQLLADVSFESKYMEAYGTSYLIPTFGEGPKAYQGKEVLVSGYFIPLNKQEGFYVLSKNPYASCYFCGAAGPETIVEIQFKPGYEVPYRMDERVTLKGVLRLNNTDVDHCNYILERAE